MINDTNENYYFGKKTWIEATFTKNYSIHSITINTTTSTTTILVLELDLSKTIRIISTVKSCFSSVDDILCP